MHSTFKNKAFPFLQPVAPCPSFCCNHQHQNGVHFAWKLLFPPKRHFSRYYERLPQYVANYTRIYDQAFAAERECGSKLYQCDQVDDQQAISSNRRDRPTDGYHINGYLVLFDHCQCSIKVCHGPLTSFTQAFDLSALESPRGSGRQRHVSCGPSFGALSSPKCFWSSKCHEQVCCAAPASEPATI